MLENRILLTTPTVPYPTLPANDSLTDATGQRFTKGDDIFSILSHTHCFANHILAQNIDVPSVLLEYPEWQDFTDEVDRGYPIVGISAFPVHLDTVMKMCRHIRRRSPGTKILLGSYAGQAFQASYDEETQKKYVDYVVQGEGVQFLRQLLGESTDRPIRQRLMPKAGGSIPFVTSYPQGTVAFLVSGLGCIGGCDFCSTTALFGCQRVQLLSPEELVLGIQDYCDHFPGVQQVFIVEEDHFRYPRYLRELRSYWLESPAVMEQVDWFGFGSVDHIGRFAQQEGWDALAELGIGAIFIGVESKFAGQHGYDKRDDVDAREVFSKLHAMGIRTVGAWICGWDWHNQGSMYEDLNYFVSLYPTYQQLTRLSPFPGTVLWEKLREDGRVMDVPWEDVHFWSGAQKNAHLEPHETLNLTEYGYDLLYRTWGPSLLRRLDVQLNGYQYCLQSDKAVMRRHRALHNKRQASLFWCFVPAMDRFAPNGVVRRRVRTLDAKYRAIVGEPTPMMKALSRAIEGLATSYQARQWLDPANRHPKQEPYKRYLYTKNGTSNGERPYDIEIPSSRNLSVRLHKQRERLSYALLEATMRAVRTAQWSRGERDRDDYLLELVHHGRFGFGF
jgi:haloalkane dehalogenase